MSTVRAAVLIAMKLIEERVERIYDINEGFDGECSAEDLAKMALESFGTRPVRPAKPAPAPTPKPAAKARKSVACKYCHETGFHWVKVAGAWQLHNDAGVKHTCLQPRPGEVAGGVGVRTTEPRDERVSREHWNRLIEIFTDMKTKGVPRSEATDALEYDSDQEPAPPSVMNRALDRVYGKAGDGLREPATFSEALRKI